MRLYVHAHVGASPCTSGAIRAIYTSPWYVFALMPWHIVTRALIRALYAQDASVHPPVTLIVWVSDPDMVQQVLMDRHTFPSRGPSGLDSTYGSGELPHSFVLRGLVYT